MILGDAQAIPRPRNVQHGQRRITIDEVFRRVAARRPDAIALDRRAEPRSRLPTARRCG